MTSTLIAPVIPSASRRHHPGGLPAPGANPPHHLPPPDLSTPRLRSALYGLASLDCNGRIADNNLLRALGWDATTRLDIREQGGLLLITSTSQGVFSLTRGGHLRLPATARRWCGLAAGDRVLLMAEPDDVVRKADVDRLREHGLSDIDVFQIVLAVALRRFFAGVLDAVGAEPDAVYDALGRHPCLRGHEGRCGARTGA